MDNCVALTGATGFIGQHLITALVTEGVRVRALVRKDPPSTPHSGVQWVRGDLSDVSALAELVRGAKTAIHCAGVVRGASPQAFDAVNAQGTARLVEAAVSSGTVGRFLLISSLAAREPGLSWYAASKHRAEEVLAETAGDRLPWTVFRPTAVYGPGDTEMRPVFLAMRRGIFPLVGDPTARISLLHVEDLVAAVMAWQSHADPVNGIFALHDGTPHGYTWRQIARIAEDAWGRRIRSVPIPVAAVFALASLNLFMARIRRRAPMLTPGKVRELRHPDWSCDNDAATSAFGWKPNVDLATALLQQKVLGS